ncbi:Outer membrane protein beta-barrel family protein [compost metagenome]
MRENTDGYLKAINDFYEDGSLTTTEVTDQFKQDGKALDAFNGNLTFTEPLSKSMSLGLNYRIGLAKNHSELKSYNRDGNGSYTNLDSEYSNDFIVNQFSNQAGATFTYQKGKRWFRLGGKFTNVELKQTNRYTTQRFNRNFVNVNPQFSFRYSFSAQESIMVNYNGATIQPSIEQIQPIKVNTDPLNIIVGNANLHPAYAQELLFSYNVYQSIPGFSLGIISSYNMTTNPIVSSVRTDAFGRMVYQIVNIHQSASSFVFRGDIGKQLKAISSHLSGSFLFNATRDLGLINSTINERYNNTLTSSVNFSKSKTKKYDLMVGFGPRFFTGSSSLQSQLTNNGHGYDGYLIINLYLPHKFEIRTNSTFNYQSATVAFDVPYRAWIIDGAIARKFLKDESLKLSVSIKDLLNQNIGFNRRTSGMMITQTEYATISRYLMCTLSWDFSRFGKSLMPQN